MSTVTILTVITLLVPLAWLGYKFIVIKTDSEQGRRNVDKYKGTFK